VDTHSIIETMDRITFSDSNDIHAQNSLDFGAKGTYSIGIARIKHTPYRKDRETTVKRSEKRIRRRHLQHDCSPRRASIFANALLLLFMMIFMLTTMKTISFAEASTIPFGRFAATAPKISKEPSSKGSSLTKSANSIFGTRAGFVGPASGGLAFESLSYYLRVALAGGVAGATGSAVLYPIDSAKTLRQSDPSAYSSVKDALFQMLRSKHAIQRVYKGILPAALGAIPSSALYFGAYESSKVTLQRIMGSDKDSETGYKKRLFVHGLAAASGNVLSSFVFVPKEVIKQQLQMKSGATIRSIVRERGITGLYAGYGATLLRNIPSATIRFVLYEELKRKWAMAKRDEDERTQQLRKLGTFLAGAVAGSTSSFVMTPVDVVKTRLATGSCPLGVKNCMVHVVKEVGWKGLYAGAGSRVLWSGAFSAIGFGTFEMVKGYLGVANTSTTSVTIDNKPKGDNSFPGTKTTTIPPTNTLAKATIRKR